uniref:S-formylglutathione hydrolase n=1 Tax=Bionectria ochroleuca TaxID=29856 RepID=A0A8H7TMC7_BIOOC
MAAVTTNATITTFGGRLLKLTHQSATTGTPMNFNLFIPPNVTEKGFLTAHAGPLGIALLYPDTSPRGTDLPGEHDAYDFGSGAGFYIDATKEPWSKNYKMESYVSKELPSVVFNEFKEIDSSRVSISGHSMGGHGALTLYLKNPGAYKSAFSGYLGEDKEEWKKHDASELVKGWKGPLNALVDVGTGDNFYKQSQLLPENLEKAAKDAGVGGLEVRYQDGYDHSYFFISTFGADHLKHHAKFLL